MADRKSTRKPAADLAGASQSLPGGDKLTPAAASTADSIAATSPIAATRQPGVGAGKPRESAGERKPVDAHGAEAALTDEDTIEGDLVLAAELDTETIAGDDPLASLDLSEELATIEAATNSAPAGNAATGNLVMATAVSAEAVGEKKPLSSEQPPGGKKQGWGKKLPWSKAAVGEAAGDRNDREISSGGQTAPAERLPRKSLRDRLLMRSVPSWLISMMLHVAMLMALAAIQLEPVREAMGVLLTANAGEDTGTTLDEEFEIRGPDLDTPVATAELEQSLSTPSEFTSQELALPETTSLASAMDATVDMGSVGNVVESILPSSALNAATARMSSSLSGRLSGAMKSEMLERFGGNAASEKSVAMALKWLSDHQDRSGGWTFGHSHICRGQCKDDGDIPQATNAATALALLPFLGAGQTHVEGNYKATVHNGLKFLISRMKVTGGATPTGSWHESGGSMYSHGLASIVVCEAYAMTRDPDLLQPAQLALNYIVHAQDPRGGGWRYEPKQPGDTSVVGWQLMALKSGAMGNLVVPHESFRLANSFLDAMAVNGGAYYGYDQPTSNVEGRQATTAVGLLCRMYLGWSKDHPGMQEGVKYLSERGPSVEDVYYSYYATQVLRQYGGAEWNKWNTAMRDGLIKAQVKEGHAAGSWFSPQGHNLKGGRLYCTAMSAMMLEVYYRHMPLYSEKSSDDDFEL